MFLQFFYYFKKLIIKLFIIPAVKIYKVNSMENKNATNASNMLFFYCFCFLKVTTVVLPNNTLFTENEKRGKKKKKRERIKRT